MHSECILPCQILCVESPASQSNVLFLFLQVNINKRRCSSWQRAAPVSSLRSPTSQQTTVAPSMTWDKVWQVPSMPSGWETRNLCCWWRQCLISWNLRRRNSRWLRCTARIVCWLDGSKIKQVGCLCVHNTQNKWSFHLICLQNMLLCYDIGILDIFRLNLEFRVWRTNIYIIYLFYFFQLFLSFSYTKNVNLKLPKCYCVSLYASNELLLFWASGKVYVYGSTFCVINFNIIFFSSTESPSNCPCGHEGEFYCKRCERQAYCSSKCQTRDWPRHDPYCIKLKWRGLGDNIKLM